MVDKGRGKVTRVDFRKGQPLPPTTNQKRLDMLTLPARHVRQLKLFARSILAAFLIWVGISADDSVISIFMIGFGILTILLTISNIVRTEIENGICTKND